MQLVDDDQIADISAAVDEQFGKVFFFYGEIVIAQKVVYLFSGGQPARLFVQIDLHQVFAAQPHAAQLFGFRDKKIFHQPPVQKSAQWCDADHLQSHDVSQYPLRSLRGGDQPVFPVMIKKDFQGVSRSGPPGDESFGQKNTFFSIIQDETESQFFFYFQRIVFTDADHIPAKVYDCQWVVKEKFRILGLMSFMRLVIFLKGPCFPLLIGLLLIGGGWHCKAPAPRNPADITYENGTGKTRSVKLPDGSDVVMSARTVIRISKGFNQSERDLDLDGEAIFTVNADAGRPFIVHTRNLQIQVLGTLFRVDAYSSNAGEEVDVLSGKLNVKKSYHSETDNEPEIIVSGEMVMINRDIDLMEKEKLDSTELKTLRLRVQTMETGSK